jgi:transcriptional regulator with XRE-family HTH domain
MRISAGLSRSRLALIMGVAESQVIAWERGDAWLSPKVWWLLKAKLAVPRKGVKPRGLSAGELAKELTWVAEIMRRAGLHNAAPVVDQAAAFIAANAKVFPALPAAGKGEGDEG